MRHRGEFFYAGDVMVALADPYWLQGEFGNLVRMFDIAGLRMNAGNMVRIICRQIREEGTQ